MSRAAPRISPAPSRSSPITRATSTRRWRRCGKRFTRRAGASRVRAASWGRRLKLASDAVGLLDTSDAGRRSRALASPARERSWSAAPASRARSSDLDAGAITDPSLDRATGSRRESGSEARSEASSPQTLGTHDAPSVERDHPASDTRTDTLGSSTLRTAAASGDEASSSAETDETTADRELTRSGYRLGAPRAHGPDPYARFDNAEEPPSNVRHFPTRERELGEDLKLSGLLGPSPDRAEREAAAAAAAASGDEHSERVGQPDEPGAQRGDDAE